MKAVKEVGRWVAQVGAEVADLDTVHRRRIPTRMRGLIVVKQEPKPAVPHQLLLDDGGGGWCIACRGAGSWLANTSCEGHLGQKFDDARTEHQLAGSRVHELRRLACFPDDASLPIVVCLSCGAVGTRKAGALLAPCRGKACRGSEGDKLLNALKKGRLLRKPGVRVDLLGAL